jgi:hypothetical protein
LFHTIDTYNGSVGFVTTVVEVVAAGLVPAVVEPAVVAVVGAGVTADVPVGAIDFELEQPPTSRIVVTNKARLRSADFTAPDYSPVARPVAPRRLITLAGMPATGGCDCRGVRYSVEGELRDVYNCHCERCRRITGHHMAATAAPPERVSFVADQTLQWYEPAVGVQYGFCGTCGSTLFWRTAGDRSKLCIAAGTLDQPTGLTTTTAWWVAEAGDYHHLAAGLTDHPYDG